MINYVDHTSNCFQANFLILKSTKILKLLLQYIRTDMWTDESLDYRSSSCDRGQGLCKVGMGVGVGGRAWETSKLFGSAGPSQRPNHILYLAETKSIVRILSGFKRQSEWGNGGAHLTLKASCWKEQKVSDWVPLTNKDKFIYFNNVANVLTNLLGVGQ